MFMVIFITRKEYIKISQRKRLIEWSQRIRELVDVGMKYLVSENTAHSGNSLV